MSAPEKFLPHPADLAARKALNRKAPDSLARVLRQARASDAWRAGLGSGRRGPKR